MLWSGISSHWGTRRNNLEYRHTGEPDGTNWNIVTLGNLTEQLGPFGALELLGPDWSVSLMIRIRKSPLVELWSSPAQM